MSESFDLAIVGAGPAGMAAASLAARLGLHTCVYDEHEAPGGQIYRSIEALNRQRPAYLRFLGDDYADLGHSFNYFLQALPSIHLHSKLDIEVTPTSNATYIYLLAAVAFFILILSFCHC